jgi:hypothetical protein
MRTTFKEKKHQQSFALLLTVLDKGWITDTFSVNSICLCTIVFHKGDTIAIIITSAPPVVLFMRDLIGPKLTMWNVSLQRLATI